MRFTNWAARKKPKILFQKKHEGARGQNILHTFKMYSKIYVLFVKSSSFFLKIFYSLFVCFFFLIFLKVTRENYITLIWRFVHVHLFVFKWLKFNFYVGISDNIYIFFLILDVTISWEKMQINFKILEKC